MSVGEWWLQEALFCWNRVSHLMASLTLLYALNSLLEFLAVILALMSSP